METIVRYHHRETREDFIRYLADRFPKCFFVESALRRPLKLNIIDDLIALEVLNHDALDQTLSWYTGDFKYQYGLVAGTERIDLNGRKAGVVTTAEQRQAQTYIKARKVELAARQAAVIPVAKVIEQQKVANGPAAVTRSEPPTAAKQLHPTLAAIQAAVVITNDILNDQQYAALRTTLAAAALKEVVRCTEQLIGELTTNTQTSETANV